MCASSLNRYSEYALLLRWLLCLLFTSAITPAQAADYFASFGVSFSPAAEVSFQDEPEQSATRQGKQQQRAGLALSAQTGLRYDLEPFAISLAARAMIQQQNIDSYVVDNVSYSTQDALQITDTGLSAQLSYGFWERFRAGLSMGAGFALLDLTQAGDSGYEPAGAAYFEAGLHSAIALHPRIELESELVYRRYGAYSFDYINAQRAGTMSFDDKGDLRFENRIKFYF